ncbi:MAG: mandelate racemase/muconate lactonizing enzyme family protein [Actinobacteria bacterium]|nr:mandelate racemase/muconate lactonizing enzyme family protein [Actinomycetota bacterium]
MAEATQIEFPAVEEVRLRRLAMPLEEPIRSGIHAIDSIHLFTAEVSAGGSTGLGYAFSFRPNEIAAVAALGADLAKVVMEGRRGVRAHWQAMWDHLNFIGHEGAGVMAMAAIDTALWDLLAREAGLPLYRLLGAAEPGVDVYGAGGWISWPVERVVEEARSFAAAGYRAYKMRVGSRDWRGDAERVRTVREALDPGFGLMVDVNQAWSVDVAMRFGQALEEVGLIWIEEPTDAQDHAGQARLARRLHTPIAAGETLWGRRGFTELLAAGGVDVVQLDLMRCGGITPFMAIVPLVEATRAPVTSHLFTPISAHLLAACARPYMAEHLPSWFDPFFAQPPRIVDGTLLPTEEPGIGLELAASARERWEVRS